jgi:hypothetical protein
VLLSGAGRISGANLGQLSGSLLPELEPPTQTLASAATRMWSTSASSLRARLEVTSASHSSNWVDVLSHTPTISV